MHKLVGTRSLSWDVMLSIDAGVETCSCPQMNVSDLVDSTSGTLPIGSRWEVGWGRGRGREEGVGGETVVGL